MLSSDRSTLFEYYQVDTALDLEKYRPFFIVESQPQFVTVLFSLDDCVACVETTTVEVQTVDGVSSTFLSHRKVVWVEVRKHKFTNAQCLSFRDKVLEFVSGRLEFVLTHFNDYFDSFRLAVLDVFFGSWNGWKGSV